MPKDWATYTVYLLIRSGQEVQVYRRKWLADLVAEKEGGYVHAVGIIDYKPGYPYSHKDFIQKKKENAL